MDSSANSSFYRPTANLDPPGSPLIRGDRNYFPDGLKFKRIPLSASFRGTLTPSLETRHRDRQHRCIYAGLQRLHIPGCVAETNTLAIS